MNFKGSDCLRRMLAVSCELESFPDILDASPSYTGEDRVSGVNMTFRGCAVPFAGNQCRADQGTPITRRHGTRTTGQRSESRCSGRAWRSPARAWPVVVCYVGQGSNDVSPTEAKHAQ